MTVIGNILWFLFGGLIGGLAWVLAGCLWCVTIIGIPVGLQCFKFASLAFFPFGKEDGRRVFLSGGLDRMKCDRLCRRVFKILDLGDRTGQDRSQPREYNASKFSWGFLEMAIVLFHSWLL